jgi:hypothetical protein
LTKLKINKITQSGEFKKKVLWWLALLVIIFVLFFANPEKIYLTKCLFFQTTGYSCPSCGLSRSLHAVSHLNFLESIHFHLMGPIIYFVVLVLLMKFTIEIITRLDIRFKVNPTEIKISIISFLGLWMFFFVVRFVFELYNH